MNKQETGAGMMQWDFSTMETPIIPISDETNEISVLREDLLPFSFGGNKVRIAQEFINDMFEQGKDCIVEVMEVLDTT